MKRPLSDTELPEGPRVVFYYTGVFHWLIARHRDEIGRRLTEPAVKLRADLLAPRFAGAGVLPGPEAWEILWDYLNAVENKLAALIRRRSPAYWFHLYRRIRPTLSEVHDSKRDATTVRLVRRHAELAFSKHGDLNGKDLGPLGNLSLDTLLGGFFKTANLDLLRSERAVEALYAQLVPQEIVMTEFSLDDFLSIFEIEGWAYEYWRTAAAMRSAGKGSPVSWETRNDWIDCHDEVVHPVLFAIYDERIKRGGAGLPTRLGTWTNDKRVEGLAGRYVAAQYKVDSAPDPFPTWDVVRKRMAESVTPTNFVLFDGSLEAFQQSHAFMSGAFEKRHGFALEELCFTLSMLTLLAGYTGEAILQPTRQKRIAHILTHQTNLRFRGYWLVALDLDGLCELIEDAAPFFGFKTVPVRPTLRAIVEFLALSKISAKNIGLWSGGKRPLLVPMPDRGYMLDLVAVIPLLTSLFFGVKADGNAKGSSFEEASREAFREAGLDLVRHGRLEWLDGAWREADAIMRDGDRLVVFECVAVEEPVDLEISKPQVFADRKDRIAPKLCQAASLAEALRARPKGANFDFGWAKKFDWRVVCPHHEFAWDLGDEFFDDIGEPRIVTIQEAIELIEGKAILPYDLRRFVHRARRESETASGT
ncbi:hypothetical protein [Terricaulis silvestris]|uniref:Uncharacterized protein n=1 Tax=Terricaulis silvestris TaxID=2686094 RepID=A0A6I6MK86_9CAUL|nr:hypothetical protein [Terricaulis silvestris]QGZ93526.1 hypothetical protein DSM104635_00338 [Terricaulis silvestris]